MQDSGIKQFAPANDFQGDALIDPKAGAVDISPSQLGLRPETSAALVGKRKK